MSEPPPPNWLVLFTFLGSLGVPPAITPRVSRGTSGRAQSEGACLSAWGHFHTLYHTQMCTLHIFCFRRKKPEKLEGKKPPGIIWEVLCKRGSVGVTL